MEVPRLAAELELQLQAYATAMATLDLRLICHLHCSLRQHWILNPLCKARDRTTSSWILCWVLNLLSHNANSLIFYILDVLQLELCFQQHAFHLQTNQ